MTWMRDAFACHTVILYGSRVRGEFRADSDYDFLAIRRAGPRMRVERMFGSAFLDLSIYSEAQVRAPDTSMLNALDGIVLTQKAQCGTRFLQKLAALHAMGPAGLTHDELEARRLWIRKMLPRSRGPEALPGYWRVKLVVELLENYFHFRHLWWLGAKRSFAWLGENDRPVYDAFHRVLSPTSSHDDLIRLAAMVSGNGQDDDARQ